MALSPGEKLSPYEILSSIGKGQKARMRQRSRNSYFSPSEEA